MKPLRPRYAKIERLVKDLLSQASITKPPIRVDRVADMVGATIRLENFDDDVSGVLIREVDACVIGVHRQQSKVRQRFTVAHELGHLLLHEGKKIRVDKDFRVNWRREATPGPRDIEEIEANSFAANLLMPRDMVEVAHGSTSFDLEDETEVARLALIFDVSKQAMSFRLSQLFGYSTFGG